MGIITLLFFSFIFLTVYSYVIYPLFLGLFSFLFRRELSRSDKTPSVTLIISAFNEEAVIERKLKNALEMDYPKERLQIMVVSDQSSDQTDEIVKAYSGNGIFLLAQPVRKGKTAGLNEAVLKAAGEILVFSDADSMYPSDAIRKIVDYLSDPKVGLVTGSTRYLAVGDEKIAETSGIYTRLEKFIKQYESKIGSCVGADGAIFGMHKSLYQPLLQDDINDLVIPLNVVRKGYRVVLHEELYCLEASSPDASSEYRRQMRITNRTLRALFRHKDLMNFFRHPLFSFEIISHKLIRLSVPIFMALLIPLNLILLREGLIYELILAAQAIFYGGALAGYWRDRRGKKTGGVQFIYHFVLVNISILRGWLKFLSGEKQVTWNPR
jgi:cellulose synthase/poly-beta-1,6-N-acetylglucosamine synthase-like glycosyltransferase